MSVVGPTTNLKTTDPNTGTSQDLGSRYVSNDHLLDVYPNLVPGRTSPGLWAWGSGSSGTLGDGTTVDKSSPVQIGTSTDWTQVSFGGNGDAVAIKTDGSLWVWGFGSNGIGDGTTVDIGYHLPWIL